MIHSNRLKDLDLEQHVCALAYVFTELIVACLSFPLFYGNGQRRGVGFKTGSKYCFYLRTPDLAFLSLVPPQLSIRFLEEQKKNFPSIEIFSSLGVYFIKLSTTNYCTHTSINITPHLPLKVVMGLIIVFVGFKYRIRLYSGEFFPG